jgi:O-antigen/teichoic acid export membrane protein
MFHVLLGLAGPLIGLNTHGAVSLKYFDRSETDLPAYVGNCLLLLAGSSAVVGALGYLAAPALARYLRFPAGWLWAAAVAAVGQFVILLVMTLWQADNKPMRYCVYQNVQTLMNLGLSVIFVVVLGIDWRGRVIAHLTTVTAFAVLGLVLLRKEGWLKLSFEPAYLRHAILFGVPLIPHAVGGMLITQTDRVFIANMVSVADAGVYSVGYQVASLLDICASSFNLAYVPWLYARLSNPTESTKEQIVKLTYIYFLCAIVAAAVLSLVTRCLLHLFVGPQFGQAYRYATWLAFGFCFNGMYYMVANYIFYASKTYLLSLVTLTNACINIALNYLLIKRNGAVGAAQATAIAYLSGFLLTWLLSSLAYEMPWKPRWLRKSAAVSEGSSG